MILFPLMVSLLVTSEISPEEAKLAFTQAAQRIREVEPSFPVPSIGDLIAQREAADNTGSFRDPRYWMGSEKIEVELSGAINALTGKVLSLRRRKPMRDPSFDAARKLPIETAKSKAVRILQAIDPLLQVRFVDYHFLANERAVFYVLRYARQHGEVLDEGTIDIDLKYDSGEFLGIAVCRPVTPPANLVPGISQFRAEEIILADLQRRGFDSVVPTRPVSLRNWLPDKDLEAQFPADLRGLSDRYQGALTYIAKYGVANSRTEYDDRYEGRQSYYGHWLLYHLDARDGRILNVREDTPGGTFGSSTTAPSPPAPLLKAGALSIRTRRGWSDMKLGFQSAKATPRAGKAVYLKQGSTVFLCRYEPAAQILVSGKRTLKLSKASAQWIRKNLQLP